MAVHCHFVPICVLRYVVWIMAKGGTLEDRPRYNSSLPFETFLFPPGFDLKDKAAPDADAFKAIAAAPASLQQWRESWLNPEGWVTCLAIQPVAPAGDKAGK